LDFWVMDDDEYNHFKNGEGFNYHTAASSRSVSSLSTDWNPPINKKIVFVWDNYESTSKTVSMDFSESHFEPLLHSLIGFWDVLVGILGWFLAAFGIGAIIEGLRRKPTIHANSKQREGLGFLLNLCDAFEYSLFQVVYQCRVEVVSHEHS